MLPARFTKAGGASMSHDNGEDPPATGLAVARAIYVRRVLEEV